MSLRIRDEYYLIVFCFQYELLAAKFIRNSPAARTVAWFLLDSCGIDESASNIGWYIVIFQSECRLSSFAGSVYKIKYYVKPVCQGNSICRMRFWISRATDLSTYGLAQFNILFLFYNWCMVGGCILGYTSIVVYLFSPAQYRYRKCDTK